MSNDKGLSAETHATFFPEDMSIYDNLSNPRCTLVELNFAGDVGKCYKVRPQKIGSCLVVSDGINFNPELEYRLHIENGEKDTKIPRKFYKALTQECIRKLTKHEHTIEGNLIYRPN